MTETEFIQKVAIWVIPLLFAITLHEVAHGWVACFFGDKTAKFADRLSLNPLKHIDLIGTVLVPLVLLLIPGSNFTFGWAKPVPVDARNLKQPTRDMALIALAGPMANGLMAILFALIIRLGMYLQQTGVIIGAPLTLIGIAGVQINTILMILNLLPFPSLDGGNIMLALLPKRLLPYWTAFEPYSLVVLLALLLTGILSFIMGPFVVLFFNVFSAIAGCPLNFMLN